MNKHIHLAIILSFTTSVSSLYSMDQLQLNHYNPAFTLKSSIKQILTLFTYDQKKIVFYDEPQKLILHTIQLKYPSFDHDYSPDENFQTFAFTDFDNRKEIQHCIFDIRSGIQTKLPTFPGETFISFTCFHPTDHILAAYIYPKHIIRYWDMEKHEWLTEHEIIDAYNIPRIPDLGLWDKIEDKDLTYKALHYMFKHNLSFSRDGKSIIIDWAIGNKPYRTTLPYHHGR